MIAVKKMILFAIFLGSIYSCSDYQSAPEKYASNYDVKMLIRAPGNCAQLITFKKNGKGTAVRGLTNDYYLDTFTHFKRIQFKSEFKITKQEDLFKINNLINEIDTSRKKIGGFRYDAIRIQLYIHNELKIDIYSVAAGTKADDILAILRAYFSYNIYDRCF